MCFCAADRGDGGRAKEHKKRPTAEFAARSPKNEKRRKTRPSFRTVSNETEYEKGARQFYRSLLTTITSTWTTLAHHGMVIVPIGYAAQELFDVSQVRGGTPYGATTIAGGDGSRQPSQEELSIARYQGEYVAGLAVKLNG